jgi:hypothetical protein
MIRSERSNRLDRIRNATKAEALAHSKYIKGQVKLAGRTWINIAKHLKAGLRAHEPEALGMNAKQWIVQHTDGQVTLSDAFKKMRILEGLKHLPEEKILEIGICNGETLCRLPEKERKSPEWVRKATEMPKAEFSEAVETATEVRTGHKRSVFVAFHINLPEDIHAQLEAAIVKIARVANLDIQTRPGLRIQAIEYLAQLVNGTEEQHLVLEMEGGEEPAKVAS